MGRLLIFGDSIAWGSYDTEMGGWAARLRQYLDISDYETELYNMSISGDTTSDVLVRLENECSVRSPDWIIFAIGINDSQYMKSKDNPRANLGKFIDNITSLIVKARMHTKKIVFIGMTRIDESRTKPVEWNNDRYYDNDNIMRYDTAMQVVCREKDVPYLRMHDLLDDCDLDDGVHPNSRGHEKMHGRILGFLVKERFILE